jgi:hypothetical protein
MNGDDQKQSAPDNGEAGWQYKPEATPPPAAGQNQVPGQFPMAVPEEQEVVWSASEFVAHNKGVGWYATLGLAAVALAAVVYLITRDTVSVVIIIFVALILGIAAVRKPRVLNYQLNGGGLMIGQKFYPYSEFKSFSVMREGAFSSIMFIPLKRFMPPISIYYDPEDEERIVEALAEYLPMENRTHDAVDSLIRHIRF